MKEISELLGNLFDSNFIREGQAYIEFNSQWNKIVGLDIASHVKIDDLIDNQLIVHADHPGWAQVFLLKKNAILSKVKKEFPQLQINNISIRYKDKMVVKKENIPIEVKEKVTPIREEKEVDLDFFDLLSKFKERSDS